MTTFLLLISFLLHIITLTIIYQLIKQMKNLRGNNNTGTAELMETYLQEIKEENRMLEANLGDTNDKHISADGSSPGQNNEPHTYQNPPADESFVPSSSNLITEVEDTFEMSQQAKILQLHDSGLSNEEIASRLLCGKTEVELMIKLHPKTNKNA